MNETCCECGKPARWLRMTQFAGNHPYCKKHATLESDFKDSDSYKFWTKINRNDTPLKHSKPSGFPRIRGRATRTR